VIRKGDKSAAVRRKAHAANEPPFDELVRDLLDVFKKSDVRFISYVPDNC
jgi:hypothetical protein